MVNERFTDTRRYQTHGEWCTFLALRGTLARPHRLCTAGGPCLAPEKTMTTVAECRARNLAKVIGPSNRGPREPGWCGALYTELDTLARVTCDLPHNHLGPHARIIG
jgi:hypothetical protein